MRSKENIKRAGFIGLAVATNFLAACGDRGPSRNDIRQEFSHPPEPKALVTETPIPHPTTPSIERDIIDITPPRIVATSKPPTATPDSTPTVDLNEIKKDLRETQSMQKEYADVFYEDVRRWTPLVRKIAEEKGVDERLVLAVIQGESAGDPNVIGGLMQVTSIHFEEGEDPNDPKTNIARGTELLKNQLDFANSYNVPNPIEIALAGYGGGDLARDWKMGEITEEEFVAKLTERFIAYHEMDVEEAGKMAGNHVLIINGAIATRMDWYRRAGSSESQTSLD